MNATSSSPDHAPSPSIIKLRGVGFQSSGQNPTRILHPLDLDISAGSAVAIMGPSGAGKTTLASLIGALQVPSEGSYEFNGDEMVGSSNKSLARFRSKYLGFVFQLSHLIDERSAVANVALGLVDTSLTVSERLNRSHEALDLVQLGGIAERRAADLSGGERHRVAIARALVKDPAVVIADEPTAALDQPTGLAILQLLREVTARGATLILVTHDSRASDFSDQLISIVDGRSQ